MHLVHLIFQSKLLQWEKKRGTYCIYQMKERDLCLNVAEMNLPKEGGKVETVFIIKLR